MVFKIEAAFDISEELECLIMECIIREVELKAKNINEVHDFTDCLVL